jgi:hypothetical protein
MKFNKYIILGWLAQASLYFAIGILVGTLGYSIGYHNRGEDQKEWDCTGKYGSKPLSEVPVNCLKYFEVNKQK